MTTVDGSTTRRPGKTWSDVGVVRGTRWAAAATRWVEHRTEAMVAAKVEIKATRVMRLARAELMSGSTTLGSELTAVWYERNRGIDGVGIVGQVAAWTGCG
ncbi:hypothetical protein M0R45_016120 [Rubus argutus]|uniref:Uncharacterized protein n=1 Tax=Rubus argutus TaxID=59490 RepID=A0AAW1XSJ6_RUBAR